MPVCGASCIGDQRSSDSSRTSHSAGSALRMTTCAGGSGARRESGRAGDEPEPRLEVEAPRRKPRRLAQGVTTLRRRRFNARLSSAVCAAREKNLACSGRVAATSRIVVNSCPSGSTTCRHCPVKTKALIPLRPSLRKISELYFVPLPRQDRFTKFHRSRCKYPRLCSKADTTLPQNIHTGQDRQESLAEVISPTPRTFSSGSRDLILETGGPARARLGGDPGAEVAGGG